MVLRPATFETPLEVVGFVARERAAGRACALIVVTGLSGGSMREAGALAAVSGTGTMAGHVSNGCIDADIALQARAALRDGLVRRLRYGAGSPFADLRLPCGGSVDVLIDPDPVAETVNAALAALTARRPFGLAFDPDLGLLPPGADATPGAFETRLEPGLRLLVMGSGPALLAVAAQGAAAGLEISFATPQDADRAALLSMGGMEACALTSPAQQVQLRADRRTAILLLFHDHTWETEVLKAALDTEAFYIGCLGSARTHAARKAVLHAEGLHPSGIARVRGPVGLVPAQRSARFLALSALSEIIEAHDRDRRGARHAEQTCLRA